MTFCSSCGTKLPSDSKFCPSCGFSLENKNAGTSRKYETKSSNSSSEETSTPSTVVVERIIERDSSHKESHPVATFFKVIFSLIIIAGVILAVVFIAQESDIFQGSGLPLVDPCDSAYDSCMDACDGKLVAHFCERDCVTSRTSCRG